MKKLSNRFSLFCMEHRSLGVPNLLTHIAVFSWLVYLVSYYSFYDTFLLELFCFDSALVLKGEAWRVFTCLFTSVYFFPGFFVVSAYYAIVLALGRKIEKEIGTLRLNAFYFSTLLLLVVFALFSSHSPKIQYTHLNQLSIDYLFDISLHLNLSLLLVYATILPYKRIRLFFLIPIKGAFLALPYFLLSFSTLLFPVVFSTYNLYPLAVLIGYFLFFGKDAVGLIPTPIRAAFRDVFSKTSSHT